MRGKPLGVNNISIVVSLFRMSPISMTMLKHSHIIFHYCLFTRYDFIYFMFLFFHSLIPYNINCKPFAAFTKFQVNMLNGVFTYLYNYIEPDNANDSFP